MLTIVHILQINNLVRMCLLQDWEYLLSSDYHRYFSATHDRYLGFNSSGEMQAVCATRSLPTSLDVDATAPLFPHTAAVLSALHLVYEVLLLAAVELFTFLPFSVVGQL